MTKRLVYIACLGICFPFLVSAGLTHGPRKPYKQFTISHPELTLITTITDTTKKQQDDKKKIKEVTRARQVPKPEKIDDNNKVKKRQRRPPGLERPPEIPRHNGG